MQRAGTMQSELDPSAMVCMSISALWSQGLATFVEVYRQCARMASREVVVVACDVEVPPTMQSRPRV